MQCPFIALIVSTDIPAISYRSDQPSLCQPQIETNIAVTLFQWSYGSQDDRSTSNLLALRIVLDRDVHMSISYYKHANVSSWGELEGDKDRVELIVDASWSIPSIGVHRNRVSGGRPNYTWQVYTFNSVLCNGYIT